MENEIIQSIILGVIQGVTEFLPISSSAHLVLTPWLFGWEDPGLTFNVALHVGTLVAVIVFFRKDWINIFAGFVGSNNQKNKQNQVYPKNMLWIILAATAPGVFAGYFFNQQAETLFRNPFIVATMLIFFGALLWWADRKSNQKKSIGKISLKDSLMIGLAQAIAIIPGVSRSGITITAGLRQGLSRKEAARFSFLLSTPIILGAAVFQMRDMLETGIGVPDLLGIIVAAISGYSAIFWLVKFVEKSSYKVFFWYRLILGVVIFAFAFLAR